MQKKDIMTKTFSPKKLPLLGAIKNNVVPTNICSDPKLKRIGEKNNKKKVSIFRKVLSILNKIAIFWCRLLYTNLATTYAYSGGGW
jgi:hypothetical protein